MTPHYTLTALTPDDIANIYAWYRASDTRSLAKLLVLAQTCSDTHMTKDDISGFMLALLQHDAHEEEYV